MAAPSRVDLTSGPITPHLIRLSVPMIWGILAIVSLQLADVYFIAQLGHVELTAISFTFPVSMIVFNLVMGLGIGTASVSSRLIGAKDTETLKQFLAHALMIAIATGIVLAIIGEIVMDPVFRALGASPEHMIYIKQFMRISLWGYVFITVPLVGNAAIRAAGDSLTPALIMVGIAIVNIPLSYLLVFGHFGAPALGVAGAAISNVISNLIAAILATYVLIYRVRLLDRTHLTLLQFGQSAKRLLTIAVPVGVTNLIGPLVIAFITALLATSGDAAVAAFGIITRIEAIAAVVLMAVAVGMSPIIGQNFGAGKWSRVEETIRQAIIFAVIWSFGVGIALMFGGASLARAFTDDEGTITIAASYFLVVSVSTALANVIAGWGSAWNALGQPKMSVALVVLRSVLGIMLPASIGQMIAGWYGLFIGLMIGNLLIGFALHFWSAKEFHKLIRV
jgi:putative MATE family efflux protein